MSFSRGPNIVTDGLVLALDAGSTRSYTSGTELYDISSYNNDGTMINDTHVTGSNIVFDGTTDYVNLGTPDSLILDGGGTISAWVKVKTWNGDSWSSTIMGRGANGWTQHDYILFRISGTTKFGFSCTDGTSYLGTTGPRTTDITLNQWYNICVTWNTTNKIVYTNGTLSQNKASTIMPISTTGRTVSLGRTGNAGYYLDGMIGHIVVYNRALTSTEILQNYNSQKTRFK